MTPAKIKQHEPTAVKREMSEKISQTGQTSDTSNQEPTEKARRSGMTKGTAGAAETGSEYEQGAAGANKQCIEVAAQVEKDSIIFLFIL